MDMNDVKSIYDNSVDKEVKKIQDSNGNIIWYKVPDGYRKVEYLESSNGNPYIDTGISIDEPCYYTAKIKFQLGATHRDSSGIFGTYVGSQQRFQLFGATSNLTFGIGNGYYSQPKDDFVATPHTVILDAKNLSVKLDGENKQATTNSYTRPNNSSGANICIFASMQSAISTSENSRIWYVKLLDNDVLIRHFIPLVRTSDSKPGVYDLVKDVFYTNQGTGEFTWGEIPNG